MQRERKRPMPPAQRGTRLEGAQHTWITQHEASAFWRHEQENAEFAGAGKSPGERYYAHEYDKPPWIAKIADTDAKWVFRRVFCHRWIETLPDGTVIARFTLKGPGIYECRRFRGRRRWRKHLFFQVCGNGDLILLPHNYEEMRTAMGDVVSRIALLAGDLDEDDQAD